MLSTLCAKLSLPAVRSFSHLPALKKSPSTKTLKTPLFLLPLTYTTTLAELKSFISHAETLARSHFPHPQPETLIDSSHLLRELQWFLEDTTLRSEEDPNRIQLRVELNTLYELWRERIFDRRPFQYIVGCEHWRDLVLSVREGVLIPRPETEMIVDLVKEVKNFQDGLWVDLGTGSGALAIGIGMSLSEKGRALGVDLSEIAVETARFNVQRYDLNDKVEIRQGSWFDVLEDVKGEIFGLVSNPPYIPSENISGLQEEVRKHEPRLALDGGKNGIECLVHLCEGMVEALRPGGFFAFETNGDKQSKLIVEMMNAKWGKFFHKINTVTDFAGIKRFVTGYRQ